MSNGVNAFDKNKWSYEKLFAYFEAIQADNAHLKGFTRIDVMNLNRDKRDALSTPFLGLEDPRFGIKNNNGDNIQWVWKSAFIICKQVTRDHESEYRAAMSQCAALVQQIYARYLHDRRRNAIIKFDFDATGGVPIKQVFRNCVGYRVTFELPSQFDMEMRQEDWDNIPEDDGVPAYATVYDGGVPIALGPGGTHVCSTDPGTVNVYNTDNDLVDTVTVAPGGTESAAAPDGTVTMKDTAGTTLGTVDVPSDGAADITAPDASIELSGVSVGNARAGQNPLNIPVAINGSGVAGTWNGAEYELEVVDPQGNPVGYENGSGQWETPDLAPTAPADPSSFADAVAAFRSDASYTLVNDLIDVWPDASGNGYDAMSEFNNDQYRLDTVMNEYVGFKDVLHANNTRFCAEVPELIATHTEFSVLMHIKRLGRYLPTTNFQSYILDLGDVNLDELAAFVIISDRLRVYITAGARIDFEIGYAEPWRLQVVYDGTQAVATDRVKCYKDGVQLAHHSTSGTIPASVACNTNKLYLSTLQGAYPSHCQRKLSYFWNRQLTAQEIADNHTFMSQL